MIRQELFLSFLNFFHNQHATPTISSVPTPCHFTVENIPKNDYKKQGLSFDWSGWKDSNLRSLVPKTSALPD